MTHSRPQPMGSLLGVNGVMFLSFVGFSATQFHGYLFERQGRTPLEIGMLFCAGFSAGIAAPLAQVKAIRWLRGPRRPLQLMLGGAGFSLALLPYFHSFLPMAMLFFLTLFCSSSIHPLNTACALEVTRSRGTGFYFLIRALGTLGFLAGCLMSFANPDPQFLPHLYSGFACAFFAAMLFVSWGLKPVDPQEAPEDIEVTPHPLLAPSFKRALRMLSTPQPKRFLWTLGLMNFANSMATLVQGNYLTTRFHGGQAAISLAWIISSTCEIPLMLFCAWLVRKSGLRAVIGFGLLGTALKLVWIGLANSKDLYFIGLMAHGCFFSGALVGFNLYVEQRYPVRDRPTLQALGALFYQGLPMALGGLVAGLLWHFVSIRAVYWVAGILGMGVAVYTPFLLTLLPNPEFPSRQFP